MSLGTTLGLVRDLQSSIIFLESEDHDDDHTDDWRVTVVGRHVFVFGRDQKINTFSKVCHRPQIFRTNDIERACSMKIMIALDTNGVLETQYPVTMKFLEHKYFRVKKLIFGQICKLTPCTTYSRKSSFFSSTFIDIFAEGKHLR